ncbi:2-keto-3-deoxygluconate permease [Xanthomonas translucens pv. poae]|uniref:2-keto-3-deoxygluconate permease n=1 Tax=Xanthomonas graminis pv. poae TaxID=227946 RepID=A0A0K2ZG72_9XANT|nr:2-keto-3-deoxygluconate transporter [Xanthomonas translucens]UKE63207.1 2-keto-3-deoxygluconate transporter [Xanthomonas translucens pv. poae]CTP84633.1 2-keto-3-deoxygluconate permease [Xanthomonas translucens pv. poae]
MQIKQTLERVPGGMMLVPLFLGAACHSAWPQAGAFLGSFSQGLIGGVVPILAVWFLCMGVSIQLRASGRILRQSGVLLLTKLGVAWLVAVLAARVLPPAGIAEGCWKGISVLALVAAMDMTNGGLFASLMQQYGKPGEAGAVVLMSVESGPLMTMLILGSAGVAVFEPRLFLGAVLPLLVGFTLGNLDPQLRALFAAAVPALIPFFAFALGNTLDLHVIASAGVPGVLLGLLVVVVTGIPLLFADRLLGGGSGSAGIAASSTAGAAVATPALIAAMAPQFRAAAPAATALVATSVIVTSLLVPVLTALHARACARRAPPGS